MAPRYAVPVRRTPTRNRRASPNKPLTNAQKMQLLLLLAAARARRTATTKRRAAPRRRLTTRRTAWY